MLMLNGMNLNKSFSGETLFENVSFKVYDLDKIGFVGVNGAGKSTLFKMIADNMDFDSGDISKSREVKIGYLEQYPISDDSRTLMGEMLTVFSEVIEIEEQLDQIQIDIENQNGDLNELISRQADLQERFTELDGMYYKSKIKSVLAGLGFSEKDFSTPLGKLSGGQKTRIALCKILLSDTNLLLLDEPTNHLDIDSIEWLEDFLANYRGAFIVVSHDRFFLDKVTNKTFELENKHLRSYDGNYSTYIAQREIEKLTEQRNYDYTTREIRRLEEVVEQQRAWKHKKNKKTHTLDNTRRKLVKQYEKRVAELDKLFTRLYEDNVSGKISDERFDMMSKGYESEQAELKAKISELSTVIEAKEQKPADTSQFLEIVRKYEHIEELTPEIMHKLIERIVVHTPDKSSGHRVQQIDIYYRFNIAVSTAIADRREYDKKRKAA